MSMFQPLIVDVNSPTSSNNAIIQESFQSISCEIVHFNEIQLTSKVLGRGAYGKVIQCYLKGEPRAVKLIDDVEHSGYIQEAEKLCQFDHPNIIKLYACFYDAETPGLVLELMEGGSLDELLHKHRNIIYQTCHALNWALQVCNALIYIHGKKLIHRDIKPLNMLLTRNYITLKLCDFGTVRELRSNMTNNRGTAAWQAPEVFRDIKYDQRCDIYSFGISFWEMIARQRPYSEFSEGLAISWQTHMGHRPARIKNAPEPLMDLIERCWKDEPGERPLLEEVHEIITAFLEIFNPENIPLYDTTTGREALADSAYINAYQPINRSQTISSMTLAPVSTSAYASPSNLNEPTELPQFFIPEQTTRYSRQPAPISTQHIVVPSYQQCIPQHQQQQPSHLTSEVSTNSLMEMSNTNLQPQFPRPLSNINMPSNQYNPCVHNPVQMPPENFATYSHFPKSVYRTNSEPATDLFGGYNDYMPMEGGEKKRKKSHIKRLINGLKNF